MIQRLDTTWEQGEQMNYRDLGPVAKGRKTRVFIVHSRFNNSTLGQVRWYPHWRKYTFFPSYPSTFDSKCLNELAEYCELKTSEHRAARSQS